MLFRSNSRLSRSENFVKLRETLAALVESSVISTLVGRTFFDTSVSTSSSSESFLFSAVVGGAFPGTGNGSSMWRPRSLPVRTESLDAAPALARVAWNAGRSVLVWAVSKRRQH